MSTKRIVLIAISNTGILCISITNTEESHWMKTGSVVNVDDIHYI